MVTPDVLFLKAPLGSMMVSIAKTLASIWASNRHNAMVSDVPWIIPYDTRAGFEPIS